MHAPVQLILIVALTILSQNAPTRLSLGFFGVTLGIAFLSICIHLLWRRKFSPTKSWLGLDTALIPGFIIVHFALPFLLSAGLVSPSELEFEWGTNRVACKGTVLGAISLSTVLFAYEITLSRLRSRARTREQVVAGPIDYRLAAKCGLLISACGVSLFILFLILDKGQYLSGSYSGLNYANESVTDLFSVAVPLIVVGAILGCLKEPKKSYGANAYFCMACVGVLLLAMLIHGDRSGVMSGAIPVLGAISYYRRIPLLAIVLSVIVVLPLMTIVGAARNAEKRSLTALFSAATEAEFTESSIAAVKQLGGSGLVTLYAVRYQDQFGSVQGAYLASGLCSIVPFSRRFVIATAYDHLEPYELDSAQLLTMLINGNFESGGVGTTTTAESYLDFGLLGIFYNHILLGVVGAWLESKRFSSNIEHRLAYLLALGLFVIIARYGLVSTLVRGILFPVVAYLVVRKGLAGSGLNRNG